MVVDPKVAALHYSKIIFDAVSRNENSVLSAGVLASGVIHLIAGRRMLWFACLRGSFLPFAQARSDFVRVL